MLATLVLHEKLFDDLCQYYLIIDYMKHAHIVSGVIYQIYKYSVKKWDVAAQTTYAVEELLFAVFELHQPSTISIELVINCGKTTCHQLPFTELN